MTVHIIQHKGGDILKVYNSEHSISEIEKALKEIAPKQGYDAEECCIKSIQVETI